MNRLLSVIGLSLIVSMASADDLDWQTVSINDGKVSLSMPGKPVLTTSTTDSIVGTVKSKLYTVKVPSDGSVSIDCSDLPGTALFFAGSDTIFDNAKGKFLSKVYGKADSWETITTGGNEGKKLMFSTPPMKGEPGYDGEAQFYLIGDYLYVISVTDKVGADLKMQNKVFPSLTFTK
ncbi:hypothetical protein [Cerasicoccus arenae]|uniref:Uncharacterized protein n=1 Tax=Cerasicoccus arenae TaxID=424488 RepID=A0A8J3D6G1_9BACT|nr:hypothetical protein [Cerasicoccus arenae]MBK1856909.1 hypothetical protein [Cerasicoccus arenae]GHB89794.1 hypothetical protein GCM10007047_00340 [Cerasicoccus arenae]